MCVCVYVYTHIHKSIYAYLCIYMYAYAHIFLKINYFWKKKNQPSKTTSGSIVKKKKNSKASCKRKVENTRSKKSGIHCYCITYLTATRCAGIYFLCCVFPCLTG